MQIDSYFFNVRHFHKHSSFKNENFLAPNVMVQAFTRLMYLYSLCEVIVFTLFWTGEMWLKALSKQWIYIFFSDS